METTRADTIQPYEAPKHHGMTAFTLQGREATANEHFWVGLSLFLPRGGAEHASSPTEKVYVVLAGEITVVTADGETVLGPMDSCRIAPGEARTIENRGHDVAKMLVISANAEPANGSGAAK
ncbi:MAG: cupin domain-containing protein [Hyphomicrobiales bacterium]|nr:cupin domain-containing protein [Hyphomicrobiales bacterium]